MSNCSKRNPPARLFSSIKEIPAMGDKGSKDKGKREQQKKAQRTPQEKRKLKQEKKNKS